MRGVFIILSRFYLNRADFTFQNPVAERKEKPNNKESQSKVQGNSLNFG